MKAAATTGIRGQRLEGGFDAFNITVDEPPTGPGARFQDGAGREIPALLHELIPDIRGLLAREVLDRMGRGRSVASSVQQAAAILIRQGMDRETPCHVIKYPNKRSELRAGNTLYTVHKGRMYQKKRGAR